MAVDRNNYLIESYLIKEYALFQLSSLAFLYLVLLINQLLLHASDLLSKNVPFSFVAELLIYASPSVLLWALPFSAIIGAMMALSRLTSDNEILALRIYGFSLKKIFRPFYFYAIFLLVLSLFISNVLLPLATIGYRTVSIKIAKSQTYDIFTAKSTRRVGDLLVSIDDIIDGVIQKIIIMDSDSNGRQRIMVAPTAELQSNSKEELTLQLNNVDSITTVSDARLLNYSSFKASRLLYNIAFTHKIPDQGGLDKKNTIELIKMMHKERLLYKELKKPAIQHQNFYNSYNRALNGQDNNLVTDYTAYKDAQRNNYINHYYRALFMKAHEKVSLAILILIFTYLAFHVALLAGKTGVGLGLAVGVAFAVFYWFAVYMVRFAVIQYNQGLVLLFVPDLAMLVIAAILHARMNK